MSLEKENPYIFSKFNPLNTDTPLIYTDTFLWAPGVRINGVWRQKFCHYQNFSASAHYDHKNHNDNKDSHNNHDDHKDHETTRATTTLKTYDNHKDYDD